MEKIQSGKILVGSMLNNIQNAKKYGKLCPKELFLLKIINDLTQLCQVTNNFELHKILNEKAFILQNKYKSICNYRVKQYDKIFISGKNEKDLNSINYKSNNLVSTDNFTSILDNTIYNFKIEDFTSGIKLDDNLTYAIIVTSLPSIGILSFNNNPVNIGQQILLSSLNSNSLQFIPNNIDMDYVVSFNFQLIII